MLIMHERAIERSALRYEDSDYFGDWCAESHDDGLCWFEIDEGDADYPSALGEEMTWKELLKRCFEKGDEIVVPRRYKEDVHTALTGLGFTHKERSNGHQDVYTYNPPRRGRPKGYSPFGGQAMVKKMKGWSMPQEYWDWLEGQDNQADALRQVFAFYLSCKE